MIMMSKTKVALSTLSISQHQTAVFGELAKLLPFKYFYHYDKHDAQRAQCGWTNDTELDTEFVVGGTNEELENVPVLIEGMRNVDLIVRRLERGLPTVYMSEPWFKPFRVSALGVSVQMPGIARLLFPRYMRMARKIVRCFKDENFYYLAQGIGAAKDLARLCGLFAGRMNCLFRCPRLTFDRVPCGRIGSENPLVYQTDKMRMWGYFVQPAIERPSSEAVRDRTPVKVLWLGRMVNWKRTDVLVKAAALLPQLQFTIVGEGSEERRLKALAKGLSNVTFLKYQRVDRVRQLMREHDVYVLTSDGGEGWGAVVNEALEEGMCVYGTREAGASASMLPDSHLYSAGNVAELRELLQKPVVRGSIGSWSAKLAARALCEFLDKEVAHGLCR